MRCPNRAVQVGDVTYEFPSVTWVGSAFYRITGSLIIPIMIRVRCYFSLAFIVKNIPLSNHVQNLRKPDITLSVYGKADSHALIYTHRTLVS